MAQAQAIGSSHGLHRAWHVTCWIVGSLHILIACMNLSVGGSSLANWVQLLGGLIVIPPAATRLVVRRGRGVQQWMVLVFGVIVVPMFVVALTLAQLPSVPTQHPIPKPKPISISTPVALAAKARFTEIPAGHALRPVQDALNKGDVDGALRLLSDVGKFDPSDRPMKQRLLTAIQAASDEQLNRSPANDYAERAHSYWLPLVRAFPTTAPSGDAEFQQLRAQLASAAVFAEDGRQMRLAGAPAATHHQLLDLLARKQSALFPSMRAHYARALDAKLFRRDVRVIASGADKSTLLLTSRMFSFNAAIEDTQKTVVRAATALRFKRVSYRWSSRIDERTTYALETPDDTLIVR